MLLKSKFARIACSLCLSLALVSLTLADTIRLKDGSIIKGKIVNFTGGQFTVVIGDGSRQRRMNFYADEIESIEFDSGSLPLANVKTSTQLPVKPNSNTTSNTTKPNNDTIITVGQGDRTSPATNPVKTDTSANTNSTMPTPVNTSSNTNSTTTNPGYTNTLPQTTSLPKPVQLNVKVLADNTSNGWTNSNWVVKKGQKIKISGKGSVSLGNGVYSNPGGIASLADKDKLMQKESTGALIAVIGDDNNEFIFIGNGKEFVAPRDGSLFLGVNEGNLDDNSGAFDVSVEIAPE